MGTYCAGLDLKFIHRLCEVTGPFQNINLATTAPWNQKREIGGEDYRQENQSKDDYDNLFAKMKVKWQTMSLRLVAVVASTV